MCSKFSTYQKVCNQISVISELTKKCAQQILKLLLFFRFFSLEKDHSHLACFWRDHNVSNVLGFDKIPRSAPEGEKSHCKLNISQNLSEISPFFFFFLACGSKKYLSNLFSSLEFQKRFKNVFFSKHSKMFSNIPSFQSNISDLWIN